MSVIATYFFVFMVISSLLGFMVAVAWKNISQKKQKENFAEVKDELNRVSSQLKGLQSHAKQLEKEKQSLVGENERLMLKLSMLLGDQEALNTKKSQLDNDGFIDTSNLDKKINDLNAQVDKLNEEIDIVKRESLEWQVQYTEVLKEKEELTLQLLTLRNSSKP